MTMSTANMNTTATPSLSTKSERFDGETFDAALDEDRLTTQLERVRAFMLRGHWHTLAEIARAVQGSEASVSARLRDLRKARFGGFIVQRRRRGDPKSGLHEYRVWRNTPEQGVML